MSAGDTVALTIALVYFKIKLNYVVALHAFECFEGAFTSAACMVFNWEVSAEPLSTSGPCVKITSGVP